MNNSRIKNETIEEKQIDISPWLRQKAEELSETIESIKAVSQSSHWKILEKNIFGGLLQSIDKRLRSEKDEKEVLRLQGQAIWAQKFCDFKSLAETLQKELSDVNSKING